MRSSGIKCITISTSTYYTLSKSILKQQVGKSDIFLKSLNSTLKLDEDKNIYILADVSNVYLDINIIWGSKG